MALLKVENLKKNFGTLEVLKGISFELNKGKVLAIIGSSGSGKTTLLRCLNFLETADSGRILVDDKVLFDGDADKKEKLKDLREKRLHFGLVFQSFNLFPHYNVLKNIMLAPSLLAREKAKAEGKSKKDAETNRHIKEEALKLLCRVGLSDKARSYPCELSGGQQQRVAIARALALKPDVLCFDEPTSALDPELTGEVLKVIKGLKSKDNTMIVVTHEMTFARDVADTVIFMANGVIEAIGTPKEIFDNPTNERVISFLASYRENGGESSDVKL